MDPRDKEPADDNIALIKNRFLYKLFPFARKEKPGTKVSIVKAETKTMPTETSKSNGSTQKQSTLLLQEPKQPISDEDEAPATYISYQQRWWLLLTVILLNIANYSHWVAFPSVTKMAAKYYDQSGDSMDLIPTLSYGLGVPCCLVATWVVERLGLRVGLHVGGMLTGIGGLMCFLSSFPYLTDDLTNDTKYYLALVGQALTGVACPFISCVPTKISQHWFSDDQRTLATILIGMANPMGIVCGQLFTPMMVHSPEGVPLMNLVWFIPAGLGAILTMWKVTADRPPTPPSPSAARQKSLFQGNKSNTYLHSIRQLFSNRAYIVMFLFVGGAMGYISTISTKIEQIMCARGYSDQLSGLSGSMVLFMGFVASFPFGILAYKTSRPSRICKTCGLFSAAAIAALAYFMRVPDMGAAIALTCGTLGTFALGVYPLALELVVECTYPVDQAIGTAFIFLSSAVQGVFLMLVENFLGDPLSPEGMLVQTCVTQGDHGHQQPKDYGTYLNFISVYMIGLILIFAVFFKTDMKRTLADTQAEGDGASCSAAEKDVEQALVEQSSAKA